MIERTFDVEGLSCGHCEAAVEVELNRLPGVERADADFGHGTVAVLYDEGRVTTEDVQGAVEEAGYTMAAFEAVSLPPPHLEGSWLPCSWWRCSSATGPSATRTS